MISKLPVENHAQKEVAQKHCSRLWMISSCPPRIASSLTKTSWLFFDFSQNLKNTHLFYSELFLKAQNQGFFEVENLQKTWNQRL
jgi:hypothetical protein